MSIVSAGARSLLGLKKVVILFYVINLVAALGVVAPAVALLHGQLSHSAESDRLFGNFDPAFLTETFVDWRMPAFAEAGAYLAIAALAYLLIQTFLAGGTIAVMVKRDEPFFTSSARYFPVFLRLLLLSLPVYAVVLGLGAGISSAIRHAHDESMVARPWAMLNWGRMLLVLVLLALVNMTFDYAKIACVADPDKGAWRSFRNSWRFVSRRFSSAGSVYAICTGIGLLFSLAYYGLSELTGQNSAFAVILLLALRQIFMLARIWARLWTWSSEVGVYTLSSTIVAPEPPSPGVAE